MSFFKEWFKTEKEKTTEVLDKCDEIYKEYGTNFQLYDSKEKFEKKFEESITGNLSKYIKIETIKTEYDKKKKELCEDFAKKLQEDKEMRKPQIRYVTNYEYVESAESRRIREQNAKEEQNRQKAANELPNLLVIVKNDFLTKLKEKISKMKNEIEDKLSNYSLSNLKIFLQNLIENEKIKDILIIYSKNESEKILNQSYTNYNHFNILLVGKSGVGKSTLINGVFDFSENEGAKTGVGKPITLEYNEFISDKRKGLRIIDSRGIEMENYNIEAVFNSTKDLIEKRARDGDPDKLVHCIWYCLKSDCLRFEDIEKEILARLMNQYEDNSLPIIIVITQNYDDNITETMAKLIQEEFKALKRDIKILPVVAKDYIQIKKNKEIITEKEGIDELIKISFEKSQKSIYPAFMKSIKEKIIQSFEIKTKEKKNKLKNELNDNVQKILNEIKENDEIDKSISKLSKIVEKTLNIFFEISNISEKSKNDITLFLNDLRKWCKETLNDIIIDLIKENSNELAILNLNEQTKVKKNNNVEKSLRNEKTFEDYRIQSEIDLKPTIINQVYYIAIKYIYNLISENLVEMSEVVMKEQIDKILPELRNIISDEKLKKLSNKILEEMIKIK